MIKKILNISALILFLIFEYTFVYGQVPQKLDYQAVLRNTLGNPIENQQVGIRISIVNDNPNGTYVYQELFTVTTNKFGLVTLEIGGGYAINGDFTNIDWTNGKKYIKVEMDQNGGSDYKIVGTSQLISVPYALYAEKSGSVAQDNDTSPVNEIQNLVINGNQLSITGGNTVTLPTIGPLHSTEVQMIGLSNDTIYLSNDNFVVLGKDKISSPSGATDNTSSNLVSLINLINTNAATIQNLQKEVDFLNNYIKLLIKNNPNLNTINMNDYQR